MQEDEHPLSGLKVIEFTHMVMGPTAGLILGDLGADVIKVEPLDGDKTRRLLGSGAGYFPMYCRNKRSLALDVKAPEGKQIVLSLLKDADVLLENFRPGAMDDLGFGYEALSQTNPRLIYLSAKGFLPGPYEHRVALDEVAQMMGGLAYMTGPPGRPLRAGASVNDVMGGMFGAIAILSALLKRGITNKGQLVKSALYENNVFLMGQHMAQFCVTGQAPRPMPVRVSAWAIYDLFTTSDDDQVFIGVVTDVQWRAFCRAFELTDFAEDESLSKNNGRVQSRDRVIPRVQSLVSGMTRAELMPRLEAIGLPFAPILRPDELFDDPHLVQSGALLPITLPGKNTKTSLPALPIEMDGHRFIVRHDVPEIGQHSRAILAELGHDQHQVDDLIARQIVAG